MKAKKKKFYVVWIGREEGICTSWNKCRELVDGYPGAKYKSFLKLTDAEQAFEDGPSKHWGKKKKPIQRKPKKKQKPYVKSSLVSFNIEEVIDHINKYFGKPEKEYIKSRI